MSTVATREGYYIYGLVDPRTSKIRYIGYSYDPYQRFRFHLRDTNNTRKVNWIKSILLVGINPEIIILQECPDEISAKKEEVEWIKFIGRHNLTNSTDGGEGVVGLVHSPQAKEKISKSKIGKDPWNKGGRHPLSEISKLARKGVNAKDKHPLWKKHHTDEANRKNSIAHLGKKSSDATKEKLSNSMSASWARRKEDKKNG